MDTMESQELQKETRFSPEEIKHGWSDYAELTALYVNSPDHFIDSGGAGEVFSFGESGYCAKIVENRHKSTNVEMFDLGNDANTEARIHRRVETLQVRGVRTPVMVDVLEDKEHSVLVMEQLDAVNMQRVLNGEEEFPDNFDSDTFFSALDDFVSAMQDSVNVVHNDLEARNVMIDRTSGLPRVIDFGRAKVTIGMSEKERIKLEDDDYTKTEKIEEDVLKYLDSKPVDVTKAREEITRFIQLSFTEHDNFNESLIGDAMKAAVKHDFETGAAKIPVGDQYLLVTKNRDEVVGYKTIETNQGEIYIGIERNTI